MKIETRVFVEDQLVATVLGVSTVAMAPRLRQDLTLERLDIIVNGKVEGDLREVAPSVWQTSAAER